jgi:3-mercaptopyruvate sulfurtransferase SseA
VAARLKERGFRRIRPLAGGFQAWVSAGFEVHEEGPEPEAAIGAAASSVPAER